MHGLIHAIGNYTGSGNAKFKCTQGNRTELGDGNLAGSLNIDVEIDKLSLRAYPRMLSMSVFRLWAVWVAAGGIVTWKPMAIGVLVNWLTVLVVSFTAHKDPHIRFDTLDSNVTATISTCNDSFAIFSLLLITVTTTCNIIAQQRARIAK